MNILTLLIPTLTAYASGGAAVQTPSIMTTVLQYVAGIGGGIVAIFLIVSLVKDAISYANGNGNGGLWKIVGKVLTLILMIGLIFLALNWQKLGGTASRLASNALDQATSLADAIGGTP